MTFLQECALVVSKSPGRTSGLPISQEM